MFTINYSIVQFVAGDKKLKTGSRFVLINRLGSKKKKKKMVFTNSRQTATQTQRGWNEENTKPESLIIKNAFSVVFLKANRHHDPISTSKTLRKAPPPIIGKGVLFAQLHPSLRTMNTYNVFSPAHLTRRRSLYRQVRYLSLVAY